MRDSDILKDSGADFFAVVVDRRDVERSDVDPTLKVLKRLLEDRETVVRFRGRLDLGFAGYDDDVRELYEIEEVRSFLADLDKTFPFWLYFLDLRTETLTVILLSFCRYSRAPDGVFVIDRADQERFFVDHSRAVTWLFDNYSLDEKEYQVLTTQITKYLEHRKHPPVIH